MFFKMPKKIYIYQIILFLLISKGFSQSTSSPYSIFGVGLVENQGFGTNRGMGGTGIAFKSDNWLNNLNPASYIGIDSLKFILEAGLFGKYTKYSTENISDSKTDVNLQFIALGFRVARRWCSSVGIIPLSSMGYRINSTQPVDGLSSEVNKLYTGEGGINLFYIGNSFKISRNLSIGMNISYYFGKTSQSETIETSDYFDDYELKKTFYLSNINLDYGLQYSFSQGKYEYTLGAIFGNKKSLNTSNEITLIQAGDTIEFEDEDADFYVPLKLGFGLAVSNGERIKAGFDYEINDWSVLKFNNPLLSTRKSERYSVGVELLPKKRHANNTLELITYRFGLNYNKSYLIIDDVPLNSRSVSIGLGIPLPREMSLINLSFEYGTEGTLRNQLVLEKYFVAHLNITLRERWFEKAKFN